MPIAYDMGERCTIPGNVVSDTFFQHAHFMPIVDMAKERRISNGDYWPCAGGLSAVNAIGTRENQEESRE